MICPVCRAPIGRAWQPHRILDSLSISWRCPNGHVGQVNGVEIIMPPAGEGALRDQLVHVAAKMK